jgi:hypothetical protein
MPNLLVRLSVLFGILGMIMGIGMGITENFTLVPAHAHLNLISWVGLFLAGVYYQLSPAAAASPLGRIHVWVAIIAAVIFPIGIAAFLLGGPAYSPLIIGGSLIALLAMLLFACVVFRFGIGSLHAAP